MHLGLTRDKLAAAGVETLGVTATNIDRARLYYRMRPTRLPLGADPDLTTHRLYGLPQSAMTPEIVQARRAIQINPGGVFPEPVPALEAGSRLNQQDGFALTATDAEESQRHGSLAIAQFLIDRDGIVRWTNVEGAKDGPAGSGLFPSDEELLAAARAL